MNVSGERILIFGDSLSHHAEDNAPEQWTVDEPSRLSGQPGDLLASLLQEAGAQAVMIDANVGRSAINFFQQSASHQFHSAAELLAADQAFNPTKVIVFLGTNDLGNDQATSAAAFAQLKDTFAGWGADVIAIGPPIFVDDALNAQAVQIYDTLRRVFGASNVIDARLLSSTQGRAGDGVHFGLDAARAFATQLLPAVQAAGGWSTLTWGLIAVAGLGALYWWWRGRKRGGLGAVSDKEWWDSLPTKKRRRGLGATNRDVLRLMQDNDPAAHDVARDYVLGRGITSVDSFVEATVSADAQHPHLALLDADGQSYAYGRGKRLRDRLREYIDHGTVDGDPDHSIGIVYTDRHDNPVAEALSEAEAAELLAIL